MAITLDGMTASYAEAQQIDGNELLESCASSEGTMEGFCIGYIIGQIEGQRFGAFIITSRLGVAEDAPDTNGLLDSLIGYCVPYNASNAQLRDVVTKYLTDHPAVRHETARFSVWQALTQAFPC
ncbi:Rap1a/Tai family immunity protein [Rhodovulum marinum]|uniref:Rap1a immunity protein domain-containing protein n=1 Tax=Rhodovulum marinum TaxID=320662 RepID=A0A4R2PQR0_9RHOB|nr:Rap1a/Tai family immunity protein [Rhodovulum marinum]TCP38037.1 hypothetical protein EV662_1231 [Rhodovulum marinum]